MSVSGGGFEQCYNAQAGVDTHTMLVVTTTLTQAPNDKQQVQPMLKVLQEQAAKHGTATPLIAGAGYCSEKNVVACNEAKNINRTGAAFYRACAVEGSCNTDAGDESPIDNAGRPSGLRSSQANDGAGHWLHQISDGFQAVLTARIAQNNWRVASGLSGVEYQTHGRTTSKS